MRADDVLEHAENAGLEFLDARSVEHCAADANHARTNLIDSHLGCLGGETDQSERGQQGGKCEPAHQHDFLLVIREKCLSVKEKWAQTFDSPGGVWYRSRAVVGQVPVS